MHGRCKKENRHSREEENGTQESTRRARETRESTRTRRTRAKTIAYPYAWTPRRAHSNTTTTARFMVTCSSVPRRKTQTRERTNAKERENSERCTFNRPRATRARERERERKRT